MTQPLLIGGKCLVFGTVLSVGSVCLAAATLEQQIEPPAIHLGETAKINITVKDGGWTRLLRLPPVSDATIIRLGQEEIEGTQEHPIIISRFAIMPTQPGEFTIPGFDVKTQASEILHVEPMTLQVFAVNQNIPQKYLQAGVTSSPIPPQSSSSPSNDTPTVISAITGEVVKEDHFGPDGKLSYTTDLTATNAVPAVANPTQNHPPILVTVTTDSTTQASPPQQPVARSSTPSAQAQPQLYRAYGTVTQRLGDGYLINAELFNGNMIFVSSIIVAAYPPAVATRDYFVPCDNPTLVDDDAFDKIVCVSDKVYSYPTVQGAQRTVRELSVATDAEISEQRPKLENVRPPAPVNWTPDGHGGFYEAAVVDTMRREEMERVKDTTANATEVCWANDGHGRSHLFSLPE
jgi:hypothetical protein